MSQKNKRHFLSKFLKIVFCCLLVGLGISVCAQSTLDTIGIHRKMSKAEIHYTIVLGAFAKLEYATRFSDLVEKYGYDPFVLKKKKSKLLMVCIFVLNNEADTKDKLLKIKQDAPFFKGVWALKYNGLEFDGLPVATTLASDSMTQVTVGASTSDSLPVGINNRVDGNDLDLTTPIAHNAGSTYENELPAFLVLPYIEKVALGYQMLFWMALMAFFFGINVAFVAIVVVVSNYVKNSRTNYYTKQRQHVIAILSSLLFDGDDVKDTTQEEAVNSLRLLTSRRDRQVIIDVLLEIKRNLTGNNSERIIELYDELKLAEVSKSKLRSLSRYPRASGIRELAYLGNESYSKIILPYLNSKKQIVQTEAIMASVLLEKQNPFGFLNHTDRPFVRWMQLCAYSTLYFNDIQPPKLQSLLSHHDPQIVLFGLRMIAIYNQLDATREVSRCLVNPDPKIRQVAIQTSVVFENWRVKALLKRRYLQESPRVKTEILNAINSFAGNDDIPFLIDLAKTGSFIEVREVVSRLYLMEGLGRESLTDLNQSLNGSLSMFIKHASDLNTNIAV